MKESQLENKTAIATNDYVRMVDENGNSVKIKKDSFMAAIRDALPSIISDGSTNGGSVLSIIDGALKTRTDANLASVLGVGTIYNINNVGTVGFRKICHIPANGKTDACFIFGVAKAQYKNKDNNYSQLVTVTSNPDQQSTLLPLFVEGVNVGETKFYYKQVTDGIDVFVDVYTYSDSIWLRIINNHGIDFSNCFAGTTETTLTTTRC